MKTLCIVWGVLLLGMFAQPYLLDETTTFSAVYGPVCFAIALALIGAVILHSSTGRGQSAVPENVRPIKILESIPVEQRKAS